jgi:hypothetical protein
MGHREAFFKGATSYSTAQMRSDPMALDGVSCTVCHQIQESNLGTQSSYSAGYIITDSATLFGPYDIVAYMSRYRAVYGASVKSAGLCGTCHTVITPYVDSAGTVRGNFIEQAPYLEWRNSVYPGRGTICQSCHMPRIDDSINIAVGGEVPRSPFSMHHFAGANELALSGMRNNVDTLRLFTFPELLDSTIMRTKNMAASAINLSARYVRTGGELALSVVLRNTAGHKVPTGIPLRRMWLHVTVFDSVSNQTVFESGAWNAAGEIAGESAPWEPHYDRITSGSQVQIYEAVMKTIEGARTYTLMRAASFAKDNRLPPAGFVSTVVSYDSVKVVGEAVTDPDFNRAGSGTDTVRYALTVDGSVRCEVKIELCYQSISPAFANHLGSFSDSAIASWKSVNATGSMAPQIIARLRLPVVGASGHSGVSDRREMQDERDLSVRYDHGSLRVIGLTEGYPLSVTICDLAGRTILTGAVASGGRVALPAQRMATGLHLVRLVSPGRAPMVLRLLIP